jgi:DNA-binding IclR family transcriptional regulator
MGLRDDANSWTCIALRLQAADKAQVLGLNRVQEERGSDRNSIQVIARAADVLRLLADEPEGLSLTEIARRTSLARSTIQRIVRALSDEEFLEPASYRGGVKLGPGLYRIATRLSVDVVELAKPYLKQLAAETNETVDLSVLRGRRVVFVEHIAGSHRLAALSQVGTEFPLYSTANGKAILSCFPLARQKELLGGAVEADTSRTITDRAALLAQIHEAASTGLAYDLEEHTEGVCAIGTALVDGAGKPYAISIPVPRQRFDEKLDALKGPLLACRDLLIAKIQGKSPPAPGR